MAKRLVCDELWETSTAASASAMSAATTSTKLSSRSAAA